MNDKNRKHVRHKKTPPKEKTRVVGRKPFKVLKPLVNLNNLFEYSANICDVTTRGERTMLIRPLNLEQFNKRVSRNLT